MRELCGIFALFSCSMESFWQRKIASDLATLRAGRLEDSVQTIKFYPQYDKEMYYLLTDSVSSVLKVYQLYTVQKAYRLEWITNGFIHMLSIFRGVVTET